MLLSHSRRLCFSFFWLKIATDYLRYLTVHNLNRKQVGKVKNVDEKKRWDKFSTRIRKNDDLKDLQHIKLKYVEVNIKIFLKNISILRIIFNFNFNTIYSFSDIHFFVTRAKFFYAEIFLIGFITYIAPFHTRLTFTKSTNEWVIKLNEKKKKKRKLAILVSFPFAHVFFHREGEKTVLARIFRLP